MAGSRILPVLCGVWFAACASTATVAPDGTPIWMGTEPVTYRIDADIPDDPMIKALLQPYASRLRVSMDMVIAHAPYDITKAKPEGLLGNLTADMVRNEAVARSGHDVDAAILNNGGLRVPLNQGPVTVGRVYELMPFDNALVILELSGTQLMRLADELAAFGGEPVSGIRFRIEDGKATDLLVGVHAVDPERVYRVATHTFLADGGGDFPTLWTPVSREDYPVMMREIFIRSLILNPDPQPRLEERIR
jgi:2',3'-cyclic-nucleotide 2'-phosphodiesterase (5'-nucleotidase family)